jgi:ectoine hydroxylase-related dioxygenase (phytanoyl-CoA dioxygenase family)
VLSVAATPMTQDAARSFRARGFVGPFPLRSSFSEANANALVSRLSRTQGPTPHDALYCRYLDDAAVYALCSDPAIVRRLKAVLGHDLLLWSASFWLRDSRTPAVPWHQDAHYWPVSLTVTAWIALSPVTATTGCLSVAPGSHAQLEPQRPAVDDSLFETKSSRSPGPDEALNLPMAAGEALLFSDRLLHRSLPNMSPRRRIALVARFTTPSVILHQDRLPFFPGHRAILVSGRDRLGHNNVYRHHRPRWGGRGAPEESRPSLARAATRLRWAPSRGR